MDVDDENSNGGGNSESANRPAIEVNDDMEEYAGKLQYLLKWEVWVNEEDVYAKELIEEYWKKHSKTKTTTKIEELQERIHKLEAENQKLREQLGNRPKENPSTSDTPSSPEAIDVDGTSNATPTTATATNAKDQKDGLTFVMWNKRKENSFLGTPENSKREVDNTGTPQTKKRIIDVDKIFNLLKEIKVVENTQIYKYEPTVNGFDQAIESLNLLLELKRKGFNQAKDTFINLIKIYETLEVAKQSFSLNVCYFIASLLGELKKPGRIFNNNENDRSLMSELRSWFKFAERIYMITRIVPLDEFAASFGRNRKLISISSFEKMKDEQFNELYNKLNHDPYDIDDMIF
ncbi:1491_t:CDS:2 [Ambispora gerdemannii]|uniref:1491_t:CDS:1 n=1 Tax=Ambispora gerdemannii TaxID=144530 RepID=A0A9N8YKX6_9GLOM|nr:1491_t:CDS:2 [Ambispora gerdemannii]